MPRTKVQFIPENIILVGYSDKELKNPIKKEYQVETESFSSIGEKALVFLRATYPKATVKPVGASEIEVKTEEEVMYCSLSVDSRDHGLFENYDAFPFDENNNFLNEAVVGYYKDAEFIPVKSITYKNYRETFKNPTRSAVLRKIAVEIADITQPQLKGWELQRVLFAMITHRQPTEQTVNLEVLAKKPDGTLDIVKFDIHFKFGFNTENPTMYTGEEMTRIDMANSDAYEVAQATN